MEDSVSGPDRGLAILERVPRNANSGLKVFVIVAIHLVARTGTHQGECIGVSETVRILEQVREVPAGFERDSIELVAKAIVQREITGKLPRILDKTIEFVLAEVLGICCHARARVIVKLRLKLAEYASDQKPREVLNGRGN